LVAPLLLLLLPFNAAPVDELESACRCGDAVDVAASAPAKCSAAPAALVGVPGADRLARGVPLTGTQRQIEDKE
jgi:hypothetical protein